MQQALYTLSHLHSLSLSSLLRCHSVLASLFYLPSYFRSEFLIRIFGLLEAEIPKGELREK